MNIALIGYGKMGHAVEAAAKAAGHNVVLALDKDDEWPSHIGADVAVEFTTPATAAGNVERCLEAGVAVVCGTTGWYGDYDRLALRCRQLGGRLLTSTNFSIGMNIMFALNERLAQLMRGRGYGVSIAETHHVHKLDAPSGTALTLKEQIVSAGRRPADCIPIASVRKGEVAGIHTVCYDSAIDTITLTHEAHSRAGLAQGVLLAAEWLAAAKSGVYTMKDVLAG